MMTRSVTVVRQYLAATFFIVIGLTAYGCGDSATVNPVVELASLTVSPGSLQPGFSGGTTQYRVDLSNDIETVTITAQPAVSSDNVTIDGQATRSRIITLEPPGSTTIINIVVSETDTNSRTYVIRLVRAGLAGNNSLQNLTVSPGTPPIAFNENTLNYTVDVASTVGSVNVTPTLSDLAATMTVNGQPATSGQARTITLNPAGQSTLITIEVTAQDDSKKSYTVLVNRGGLSGINTLQNLTVLSGTGTTNLISFSPTTPSYPVSVASTVTSVTVRPTLPPNSNASMSLIVNSGQPSSINSGEARTITLGPPDSDTIVNIIVTAQNGNRNIYVVAIDRAPSNDNNLSALTVRAGTAAQTLSPRFARNITSYRVDVASNVTSVTVSATKSDLNAAMAIGSVTVPAGTRTGQAPVTLGVQGSETPVSITVTPQTGTPKTYNLTIRRLSSNNNLSALTVTAGTAAQTLSPTFAPSTTAYTVNVATEVTEVTVRATKADADATMAIGSVTVAPGTETGQATITLNGAGTATTVSISVTAQNGTVRQPPYTITVRRAAPAAPPAPASAPDLIKEDDTCPLVEPPDPNNPDPDGCSRGTSRSDNRTTVATPRFSIAPPAAGLTPGLYIDGNKDVSASFDSTANTLRPSAALSDGAHEITYTLTAGSESGPSPALTVTIDTVVQPPPGDGEQVN